MLHTIQNNNLDHFISKGIIVIDFAATWCGPCQMLTPVFHELVEEVGEEVNFYVADVDQNVELAQQFRVIVVPTIVMLKNGKEITRIQGFQSKETLKTWLENNKN